MFITLKHECNTYTQILINKRCLPWCIFFSLWEKNIEKKLTVPNFANISEKILAFSASVSQSTLNTSLNLISILNVNEVHPKSYFRMLTVTMHDSI